MFNSSRRLINRLATLCGTNMRTASFILFLALSSASYAADLPKKVTFAEHIAPLVFENCTTCHRSGQVAPFVITNYTETRKHAKMMLHVIQERYMPPWQPETGHVEFINERRLTDNQIALFEKWVETGMAEGDATKTPKLPKFPEGWRLGEPDLIIKMDKPFTVPAEGPDIYQNFVIPTNLPEDKWVSAVEFQATAPNVVHHLLYLLDDSGRAREKARSETKEGPLSFAGMGFRPTGSLGGWAVGAAPVKLPEGLAYPLKKGSDLLLQTHFHLSGKVEQETITIGIHFAKTPPKRTLVPLQLPPAFGLFSNVNIPPGKADFKVQDSFKLPYDVDVIGAGAHAHYIGKTLKATAILPDKTEKQVFSIKDWDFNWQGQYLYKKPFRLPKGTIIRSEVTWDNSKANPRNPNSPPVQVTWGEGSNDEMGSVTLLLVPAQESDATQLRSSIRMHVGEAFIKSRLRGDKIDWEKLGIDPKQQFGGNLPQLPPKKKPSPKSKQFQDLHGKAHDPMQVLDAKAHVLFFVTTECPNANAYIPEINKIAKDYANKSIQCYLVHVDPELTAPGAKKHAEEYKIDMPILRDTQHDLVQSTAVTHTPETAVVLANGTIAYRGRIDDRFPALGKKRLAPTQCELREAIDCIIAEKPITVSRTKVVGCFIPSLPKTSDK